MVWVESVARTAVIFTYSSWIFHTQAEHHISSFSFHQVDQPYTVRKRFASFPSPSRDVTTKLSLGANNDVITELFLPRGSLVSDIPAGDGKLVNLFLRCTPPPPSVSIQSHLPLTRVRPPPPDPPPPHKSNQPLPSPMPRLSFPSFG